MGGEQNGGFVRTLLSDARQGIVGGLVWLGLTALAALLLGVVGGSVPVWSLGVVVVMAGVIVVALVASYERRMAELRGRLSAADESAAKLSAEAKDTARQLQEATRGETQMTAEAQGLVKRINALQTDLERNLDESATTRTRLRSTRMTR